MKDLVQRRLDVYNPKSGNEELNALKEITQEVALYSLYKAGFFQEVSFLGGTSLRIVHGLDRFSEDLDFSTKVVSPHFNLDWYLEHSMEYMNAYGYDLSVSQKDLSDRTIQSRFIKDESIKKVLTFRHKHDSRSKIKIKVEVDTNPPDGANYSVEYVDFPHLFAISQYDLPSLMVGKLHALLCRPYPKGRDWFDLLWYLSRRVTPNVKFLENALDQSGPWSGQRQKIDMTFIKSILEDKIQKLDWRKAIEDVRPFLNRLQAESLDLWGEHFFRNKLQQMLEIN